MSYEEIARLSEGLSRHFAVIMEVLLSVGRLRDREPGLCWEARVTQASQPTGSLRGGLGQTD